MLFTQKIVLSSISTANQPKFIKLIMFSLTCQKLTITLRAGGLWVIRICFHILKISFLNIWIKFIFY